MASPSVYTSIVPTGGAVALEIYGAVSGVATLSRAVSGSTFTQIYSGVPLTSGFYLDTGDGLPGPLDPSLYYQYQYTDDSGTTTTEFIQPAISLAVQQEPITAILIRLLQAGLSALTLPNGIKPAQVTNAMPLGGSIPMPLVVINLDLAQQGAVPIGQSNPPPEWNTSTTIITGFTKRIYRVSVIAQDASTRDFYRDNLIGIFQALYKTVLQPLGIDVTHRWQAASGQIANDKIAMSPGFYYADIMMEFEGTLDVIISPQNGYGLIARITLSDQHGEVAEVPINP